MTGRRKPPAPRPEEQVEELIRRAGSIGRLEQLAGVSDRDAFWIRFSRGPKGNADSEELKDGVRELKRRIRCRPPEEVLAAWRLDASGLRVEAVS